MTITILGMPTGGTELFPLYSFRVPAGFPSPAAGHLEGHISLDEIFDLRAPHVYLVKVEGDSMEGAGIYSGDLVIVDRGREAEHDDIVISWSVSAVRGTRPGSSSAAPRGWPRRGSLNA